MLLIPLALLCTIGTAECMNGKTKQLQQVRKEHKKEGASLHHEVTHHQPSSFSRNVMKWGCVALFVWPLLLSNNVVGCQLDYCAPIQDATAKNVCYIQKQEIERLQAEANRKEAEARAKRKREIEAIDNSNWMNSN